MVAGIFGMNTPSKLFDKEDTPEWVFIMIVLLTTFAVLSAFCCLGFVLYCKPKLSRMTRNSRNISTRRLKAVGSELTRRPSVDRYNPDSAGTTSGEMQQHARNEGGASAPASEQSLNRYSCGPTKRHRQSSRVQNVREILLNPNSLRASASRGLLMNHIGSRSELKINEELTEMELEEAVGPNTKGGPSTKCEETPHSTKGDEATDVTKGDETLDSSATDPQV